MIEAHNQSHNYLNVNRELWNKRTEFHLTSDFYDVEGFLKGKTSLQQIELKLLGDISGKSILHLQCHFGLDSISLGRMGAEVTGVDFSDKAVDAAKALAVKTNSSAKFICCDVYSLPDFLNQKFDIVFTSYGTIGWLPDLKKWAEIISMYLKPEGKFIFVDFHPVVWMMDVNFSKVEYSYFNHGAIVETETGTYAQKDADINKLSVGWNHDFGEVFGSLITSGLRIESFKEYDYSPYNCFNGLEEFEPGKFRVSHLGNKMPLVYSLSAGMTL